MASNQAEPLSVVAQGVGVALAADVPVMIWGPPGIGKSALLDALRNNGKHVVTLYGSTLTDAADVVGVTVPTTREIGGVSYPAMTRPLPDWMIDVITAQAAGKEVVIVIDEATTAPADAMAALLGLLRDGVVAGSPMKPVRRVMIANPADCGANAWTLPAPIANRVVHLAATVTLDDVVAGFNGAWAPISIPSVPEGWESTIPAALAEVGAVLQMMPGHLVHAMPRDPEQQGQAWPSPRTWEMVARLRAASVAANVSRDILAMLVVGAVGNVAGTEAINRLGVEHIEWTWKNWGEHREAIEEGGPTVATLAAQAVADSVIATFVNNDEYQVRAAWDSAWKCFEQCEYWFDAGTVRQQAARVIAAAQRAGRRFGIPPLWKRIAE